MHIGVSGFISGPGFAVGGSYHQPGYFGHPGYYGGGCYRPTYVNGFFGMHFGGGGHAHAPDNTNDKEYDTLGGYIEEAKANLRLDPRDQKDIALSPFYHLPQVHSQAAITALGDALYATGADKDKMKEFKEIWHSAGHIKNAERRDAYIEARMSALSGRTPDDERAPEPANGPALKYVTPPQPASAAPGADSTTPPVPADPSSIPKTPGPAGVNVEAATEVFAQDKQFLNDFTNGDVNGHDDMTDGVNHAIDYLKAQGVSEDALKHIDALRKAVGNNGETTSADTKVLIASVKKYDEAMQYHPGDKDEALKDVVKSLSKAISGAVQPREATTGLDNGQINPGYASANTHRQSTRNLS